MIGRRGNVCFSGAGVLATATYRYNITVIDNLLLDSHTVALAVPVVVMQLETASPQPSRTCRRKACAIKVTPGSSD